jgi:hypothetical protein
MRDLQFRLVFVMHCGNFCCLVHTLILDPANTAVYLTMKFGEAFSDHCR